LNLWIFESLNSFSHECTNVLFFESYTRFREIDSLNFWIFESFESLNSLSHECTNVFCRKNTETQKATEYFWNPIPVLAELNFLNFWIFEFLNLWIFEFFKPRMHECFVAAKTLKHKKPQNIFGILYPLQRNWILEFLNLWIFESLNSFSHECTNVLFFESYTRFREIDSLNFWIFESLNLWIL